MVGSNFRHKTLDWFRLTKLKCSPLKIFAHWLKCLAWPSPACELVKLTISCWLHSVKPFPGAGYKGVPGVGVPTGTDVAPPPPWEGRAIATHKLRLVEFSAFVEHPRDPDTVSSIKSVVTNKNNFIGARFCLTVRRICYVNKKAMFTLFNPPNIDLCK